MRITTRELTPALWPELERLFGEKGACGGCWCQAWRVKKGEDWSAIQGAQAKRRLPRGVKRGSVHGILAFAGEEPVGWCNFGPRRDFPRLERARTLRCDDPERVTSITCFFVARGFRRTGVARALLEHALRVAKRDGAPVVEGYPAKPDASGRYVDAFAWTGTRSLFEKEGFEVAGNPAGYRRRVRKTLRPSPRGTRSPARS